jgi:two-component system sensor histidine kinase KdpD
MVHNRSMGIWYESTFTYCASLKTGLKGLVRFPMHGKISDSGIAAPDMPMAPAVQVSSSSPALPPDPWLSRLGLPADGAWYWPGVLASLGLVLLVTICGFWIGPIVKSSKWAVLYVPAVVVSALRWGRPAIIASALAGAFCFDFFFLPPVQSIAILDLWYLVTLLGFLVIGLLTSMRVVKAKEEAFGAQIRESQTAALYSLTKALAAESDLDRILDAVISQLLAVFRRPIVVLLPTGEGLRIHFRSVELVFDEIEKEAASWVFANGKEAGDRMADFTHSKLQYWPLRTWQGVVGVIGILTKHPQTLILGDQRQLFETFINQAALAISRADLAEKAQQAELLQQADKLQKALLNSVSHDLRTPLVSVIGGLNSVLQDAAILDAATQRSLLETARDEAVRLNGLIQNLLDMTRLESGAILARFESCDVQEVVGAALEQMGEASRSRAISVTIPPELPLVPMDQVLIVQVLVNLLDNAIKYSHHDSPITIDARLSGDRLEMRVADRGRKIPKEEWERIFDKFFRGTSALGTRGIGLGLSICRGFVEAHNGRIWGESNGQGETAITFSLPIGGMS